MAIGCVFAIVLVSVDHLHNVPRTVPWVDECYESLLGHHDVFAQLARTGQEMTAVKAMVDSGGSGDGGGECAMLGA